jgi:predicted RNA binding protein YcfA (HicA-like mRNA interferase family)
VKYRDFIEIIEKRGFVWKRTRGDHHQYEGFVEDQRRLVTVGGKASDDIVPGVLASMIRQSGLPKALFR